MSILSKIKSIFGSRVKEVIEDKKENGKLKQYQFVDKEIRKLSSAVEQSIDGIAISDLELKLTYVNDAFARMHGYYPQEMIGMKFENLHNEKQMDGFEKEIKQVKTKGEWDGEINHFRKDGNSFPTFMSVTLLRDEQRKPVGILSICRDITDCKKAGEELRKSEEKYRNLYETIRDGIAGGSMDGRILDCNQAFADMLGYSKEELKNLTYHQLTPKQWHQMEAKIVKEQILKRGYSDIYEKEYIRKDGTVFPISARVWLVRDKDGKPKGMWGMVRDITERKKAEEAMKESESRLRRLFDLSPVAVVISSVDGKIEYTNKAASDMMGYKQNEAIGMATKEFFVDPKERDKSIRIIKKHGQRLNYDFYYKRKDGTTGIAIANSKLIDLGEGPRLVIKLNDITDRKKVEEELKQQKEFLNAVVEAAGEGIDVTDKKGNYLIYNRRMEEITGYSQKEAQNSDFPKLLYPNPVYRAKAVAAIKAALKGKHASNQEWKMTRKDGKKRNVLISTRLLTLGKRQLMIGSVRDITERKRAEEERLKAQVAVATEKEKRALAEKTAEELKKKVEEKTQKVKEAHRLRERFIADASHELRTPLSVLQTSLDLLSSLEDSKKPFLYKDIKDSIETSKSQIKNLTTIIEELSLLSRGKKPEELREKIKLENIIQETTEELKALAKAKKINYKIRILDQDLEVMGDEDMLKKLVRNLISNAIKYGREKGKVEITLRRQKKEVELQVKDNGIGISKKDLPYIFERFYRTDKGRSKEKGGVGLGLAICKWIVELHGGEIKVESKYGKGSTFKIILPLKGSWEDKIGFWDHKLRKGDPNFNRSHPERIPP